MEPDVEERGLRVSEEHLSGKPVKTRRHLGRRASAIGEGWVFFAEPDDELHSIRLCDLSVADDEIAVAKELTNCVAAECTRPNVLGFVGAEFEGS